MWLMRHVEKVRRFILVESLKYALLKVVSCQKETLKESIRVDHVFKVTMCLMRILTMLFSLRCHPHPLRWKPPRS